MKRIAFFVEGLTEVTFVTKLIEQIAGENNVVIHSKRIAGGSRVPKSISEINAKKSPTGEDYYVLIYDCGGDGQVAQRIREEHENLTKAEYEKIIGIRDVYPKYSKDQIPKLEIGLRYRIREKFIPVDFILGVMEVEAWFLLESTHFQRVHKSLTIEAVKEALNFDPLVDDVTLRHCPADDMQACYALAGIDYEKGEAKKTMEALDFAEIYCNLGDRAPYLQKLNDHINEFLS